jgi:hypothetical protein
VRREPSTPLAALDRAIELAREQSWLRLLSCASPVLLLTWLCLFVYYLEWVEGVRALRPLFALGFALTYCLRGRVLARLAGEIVDHLLVPAGGKRRHAPALVPLRVTALLGCELWLWLWLPVLALRIDILLVPLTLPLLALRGGLLPSWLAAADGTPEATTFAALREALRASEGRRIPNMIAELCMLLGALILALNLGALTAALISVCEDVLGLELSFARAFISPRNHFALILLAGLSLSALEPVRAALSAVHYSEYRLAQEAIEVRTLVERCVARGRSASLAVLALGLALTLAFSAQAQGDANDSWSPVHTLSPADECDESCREARARDDALLVDLVSILDRPEFRDFPEQRWPGGEPQQVTLESWLERFIGWLFPSATPLDTHAPRRAPSPLSLRVGALSALLIALGLTTVLYLALRRRPKRVRNSVRAQEGAGTPQEDVSVRAQDDAALDARGELCALYLASLRGLSQRGLLQLARHATNGAYVRALSPARERALLSELTRLFERARYGAALPSAAELARARELASSLCGEALP